MTFIETFTLQAPAPFDFNLSAQIFSSGDTEIRSFANGVFHQVLLINGELVLVKLTSEGAGQKPKIRIELLSNKPLTAQDKKTAKEAIRFIFNLGFDLCAFYE